MDVEFEWDPKKAERVLNERGVRFSDIEAEVRADRFDDVEVRNQKGHPGQRMFVVRLDGYAVCAPYLMVGEKKARIVTAFKSRIFNKKEAGNG